MSVRVLACGTVTDRTTEDKNMTAVYVNAGNDSSGNPRRGWVVYADGPDGMRWEGFVDEGYDGDRALDECGVPRIVATYPALDITPGAYRAQMRNPYRG